MLINFSTYVKNHVPPALREARQLSWLSSLVSPIVTIWNIFSVWRAQKRKEISYNCQTIMVEEALNDFFDATLRRIYIDNTWNNLERTAIYRVADGQPASVIYRLTDGQAGRYIYRHADYQQEYDFIVVLPAGEIFNEDQVRKLVDTLRRAGRKFKLIYA